MLTTQPPSAPPEDPARLTRHAAKQRAALTSVWSFAVLIAALVIDVNRSRMLARVARATQSQALAADAAHFASDLWSSGTVLASVTLIWIGGLLGWPAHWLSFADAAAGVI